LSPGRVLRTETALAMNGGGQGGTPVRPSIVSERMQVHNDDEQDGDEDDDDDTMSRTVNNLIVTARRALGVSEDGHLRERGRDNHQAPTLPEVMMSDGDVTDSLNNSAHALPQHATIRNTSSANAMAAAAAAAAAGALHGEETHGPGDDYSASSDEDEGAGAVGRGYGVAGMWQRQEDVLRAMSEKRHDILLRAERLQRLVAPGVQI